MHAQWQAVPYYTITFESHGGSAVAAITGNEGTEAAKPENPARTEYTFTGWFSGETGGTEYTWPHPLTADVTMHAQWQRSWEVTIFTDETGSETTAGTLRYALDKAQNGDIITFSGVTPGETTIKLKYSGYWAIPALSITKSLTIEGNGVTLTRSDSWTDNDSGPGTHLLEVQNSTAKVVIRRVHFKNGLTNGSFGGAAISNAGNLTLESCIFSGNREAYTGDTIGGGAVQSYNSSNTTTLTIRGCTFYNNSIASSSDGGGAVSCWVGNLTLTGNLFYQNTAAKHPVVAGGYAATASYNVVDVAFGLENTQAGWSRGTGDKTTLTDLDDLTISGDPFDTTTFAPVPALQSVLPAAAPEGFPATDFYGATRTFPGAPGAVK
jgi:uncharacterized repeat protein (TIGR02543 family)